MKLTEEQIDSLTNLFKLVLQQQEDGFIYQWFEPFGVTDGLKKTVFVSIKMKETEYI